MISLENKAAVITGSTRGLGRRTAIRLAQEGACVTVCGRKQSECDEVAEEIRSFGGKALAVPADVCDPEHRKRVIAETIAAFGKIDILVNNAGIARKVSYLESTEDDIEAMFRLNYGAAFFMGQLAAREMVARGIAGRIINISSTAGLTGEPDFCIYGSTKAAIIQLTRATAVELGPYGITVNSVAPGTTISRDDSTIPAEIIDAMKVVSPMLRLGYCEDIANAVVFLASDAAKSVSGQVLPVDCGYNTTHFHGIQLEQNRRKLGITFDGDLQH